MGLRLLTLLLLVTWLAACGRAGPPVRSTPAPPPAAPPAVQPQPAAQPPPATEPEDDSEEQSP
jgi:hypothetical protein